MVPFKTVSLNVSAGAVIGATLSAGSIVYAFGGDSNLWNSTRTTVQSNSASWEAATTVVQNNSAVWVPEDLAIAYAIAL